MYSVKRSQCHLVPGISKSLQDEEGLEAFPFPLQLVLLPRRHGRADDLTLAATPFYLCNRDDPWSAVRSPSVQNNEYQQLHQILNELQDPDEADSTGNLATVLAAGRGHAGVLRMLIAAAADLNKTDMSGSTAIASASRSQREGVVQILLHATADVNVEANLAHVDPPCPVTRLWLAVDPFLDYYGRRNEATYAIVRLLAGAGADPNWALRSNSQWNFSLPGTTPLLRAAKSGAEELARCLIEIQASPHMVDLWSRTPLLVAAENGHTRLVQYLISAEADLEPADGWQRTPLWTAAYWGFANTVSTLLLARADIHAADNRGRSSIWAASASGFAETAKALLLAGADLHASGLLLRNLN